MTDGRPRVFLLGLDGATFTLLRPWAEEGHLPTIARLMKEGAHGPLISTVPPVTPVAWTSMVTGVYPGKHGIFGFTKSRPESYERDLVTSRDRRRPAIWNLLDLAGLRSIVVDVPFTYPPEPINGVMVSGLGTPDETAEFVYPGMLREVLLRELGPFPLGIQYHKSVIGMIEEAHRLTEHRLALTRFLMRDFGWDFFMLVLMTTDSLQHIMWRYLDPQHPRYDPGEAGRYGPRILDYYRRLDSVIAELLALLPRDAAIMIVSDHGAGPLTSGLSLGRWACQAGLLTLGGCRWAYAPPDQTPEFVLTGAGRVDARPDGLALDVVQPDAHAGAVFRVPGLDPLRSYEVRAVVRDATPGAYLEFDDLTRHGHPIIGGGPVAGGTGVISTVLRPTAREVELVVCMTTHGGNPPGRMTVASVEVHEREDWSRTKSYPRGTGEIVGTQHISINVRGREPEGIVEPGEEYDELCRRIAGELLTLRGESGRRLVAAVHKREELYAGPYAHEASDLLVVFEEGIGGTGRDFGGLTKGLEGTLAVPVPGRMSGSHRPEGILIAHGRQIACARTLSARVVDIFSTVLHVLGVPAPDDTDGRVLFEMLAADHRAAPPAAPVGTEGGELGISTDG